MHGPSYSYDGGEEDDVVTSEASYGSSRNVRFYDQQEQHPPSGSAKLAVPKLFDCKEVEHAPTLNRADSSLRQQSVESTASVGSKNAPAGGGNSAQDESHGSDLVPAARSQTTDSKPTSMPRSPTVEHQTTSTTGDDDDDDDDESTREEPTKGTGTIRRSKLHNQRTSSSGSSKSCASRFVDKRSASGDFNNAEDNDDDDDDTDDNDDDERGGASSRRNTGNRSSREFSPTFVNKLLDRSAQMRRDSQEQRSRGDSPERPIGYSSSPDGSGSGFRQRRVYQRSQQQQQPDDEATNSNQSIYTTASSQRRSSEDEPSGSTRRPSTGSSTDRTVVSAGSAARRAELDDYNRRDSGTTKYSSSSRRDSGGGDGGFKSRFLARSRTSAAVGRSQEYGHTVSTTNSSSPSDHHHHDSNGGSQGYGSSSAHSYLSSRDRFMQ
jgi:hypothetical protein